MKKICIAFLLCCLMGSAAYAKEVHYETFTDAVTGRQIEYFDMNEDTTRNYFTQNAWFSDNNSFIVLSDPEKRVYKYDVSAKTVEPMFGAECLPLSNYAVVGPDNTVYAANNTEGNLYAQNLSDLSGQNENGSEDEVSFEVNSDGTGYSGELAINIWNGSYDRDIGYSGTDGRGAQGGKHYVYNREFTGTPDWKRWKNAFYFKVPDTFLYGNDYSTLEVEVEYYVASNCTIELVARNSAGGDTQVGSASATSGAWKTKVFTISSADGKGIVFSNKFDSAADFRIGFNAQGYVHKVTLRKIDSVSFEVNSAGTGYSGALDINIWSGSYDRDIGYSGTDGLSAVDGKHYVYNREFAGYTQAGQGWKQWKNAFYFKVPDAFLYGNDYGTVEVEVEYYVPSNCTIELVARNAAGKDVTFGSASVTSGAWKTKSFIISSIDSRGIVFSNKFDSSADFRIGFDSQGYIHKVTLRGVNFLNLGNTLGGWLPHVSQNGDISLTTGSKKKVVIYEAENKRFAETDVYVYSTHAMINPVDPNLVLYSEEGDAATTFGRIRMFNRSTMEKSIIFDQYPNSSGGETTGEAVGHEGWSGDGEHIVAVKYKKDTNVGKNGIIRMDKNGKNREYINGDYNYWHCAASYDGRWIVADTIPVSDYTNIVLIDAKTGKSHLVAKQRAFLDDPGQPHPSFNLDGTKVTFAMARRKLNSSDASYLMGVGIADVSNIVNDGQFGELARPEGLSFTPFKIGFNKDSGKNEIITSVKNIGGVQRAVNLYAAVYDGDGKLISAGRKRYYSSEDGTLAAEIDGTSDGQSVKCFMWNDENKPLSNEAEPVRMLRAAKVGVNEIVLSWQIESDIPIIKYEVYRGNQKIGETTDTVYRDSGLSKEAQYTYYVRPVYNRALCIGEDGAAVSAGINGLDFDGIYSVLGRPSQNYGLTFLENDNLSMDSFTEFKVQNGESCRMARKVLSGEEDEAGNKRWGSEYNGMFYFKCDRSFISASTNNVLIGVRYYDNREGVNLSIDYKKTDGSVGSKTVVTKAGENAWKTATVVLDDAKFIDSSDLSGYDFRFQGGYSMYISRVWAIPLDENGNRISHSVPSSPSEGEDAGLKVTTKGETISARLAGSSITENGLSFVLNNNNSNDGYTEPLTEGSKDCRQNTSASTSMFCFKVNKDIIPEDVTSVDIVVEYYGYNYNGGKIQLYYTATDGTTKTVDVATPGSGIFGSGKEWKTKTVSITDAKLIEGLNCGSDFVIKGTKSASAKIASVTVTKKSTPAASANQYVEWNPSSGSGSGLSRISGGQISGDLIYVHSANDWLKFSVDDVYLYGKSNNTAWVDITYRDGSEGNHIYLYYNTSDPTAAAPKADKQAPAFITCTGTGELKTARIPLIDANFSNYDGYDFRIGTDNGVYIKNVRVLGY